MTSLVSKKIKLDRLAEIQQEIDDLKAEEKKIVNDLRFNHDTTLSEIAAVYGVSRQAIYERFGK